MIHSVSTCALASLLKAIIADRPRLSGRRKARISSVTSFSICINCRAAMMNCLETAL